MTTLLFHKPYGVLSQFTREGDHRTLADFGPFAKDLYPVGRLDADSEGLLILTNDANIQHRLTEPKFGHERTYWAQVERIPTAEELEILAAGVTIEGKRTRPSMIRLMDEDPPIGPRPVPIRVRKHIPTCWLELRLTEGRNRQVRKMTAAIGHPTLRLVRSAILFLTLKGLEPGAWRELSPEELRRLGKILGQKPTGRDY